MSAHREEEKTANHYIDGHWLHGEGENFVSTNPGDGTILWQGNKAGTSEINQACQAAHLALPFWASLHFSARAQYALNFAKIVETKRQELTCLISLETGKPLWEALTEVDSVINKVQLSIQAYQERNAQRQISLPEANACLRYKPQGVVVVLGAFNFPAHLSNGQIIPALLAGNTLIYKPSELTPAVGQFIIECWHESGLPQGVLNGVQGDASTARLLIANDIQGLYFTGSYRTGKAIHQQLSGKPEIILALEMGGNNPLVVDETVNLDAAVYYSILSSMITAGQRCTCARRLLVPDNALGDQFLEKFIKACKKLRVGRYNENPAPFMGPVISVEHAKAHLNAQQELLALDGESLLTMTQLENNLSFLSPGIIDMTKAEDHFDEEIFAPLVQVYRYLDFDEAIFLANKTHYGLVAGILSDNAAHFQHFYKTIRAGLINWNRPTTGAASSLPFGGVGWSGNHRPGGYFAADYCSYPIASLEQANLTMPATLLPGIDME